MSIVQGLAPLSHWEVKNYVEHRLRIAGYKGAPIFTDEAYESIAVATEGIPRNVNNFCFNALSLACALRKRTVDSDVVNEVMSDLDIQRLTWGLPSETSRHRLTAATPAVANAPVEARELQGDFKCRRSGSLHAASHLEIAQLAGVAGQNVQQRAARFEHSSNEKARPLTGLQSVSAGLSRSATARFSRMPQLDANRRVREGSVVSRYDLRNT